MSEPQSALAVLIAVAAFVVRGLGLAIWKIVGKDGTK